MFPYLEISDFQIQNSNKINIDTEVVNYFKCLKWQTKMWVNYLLEHSQIPNSVGASGSKYVLLEKFHTLIKLCPLEHFI